MKRLSILFALSFVLLSFGLTQAIDFDVTVDPSYQYFSIINGQDEIVAGSEFVIQLQMGNTDGDVLGFSLNQKIYGTGDVDAVGVIYTQDFGLTDFDTSQPLVGLKDLWPPTLWTTGNFFYGDGWNDGTLPDTMAHVALSTAGWNETGITPKYEFYLNVPFTDTLQHGEICFDKVVGHPNGDHDWLFANPTNYNGPYCFFVSLPTDQPPEIECADLPTQLTEQHDGTFDITGIAVSDPDGDAVTSVTASIGTVTFNAVAQTFSWTYSPTCNDVGQSLSVEFQAHNAKDGNICTVDLVVENTAPEIAGDCGVNLTIGTDAEKTASFSATDANAGDSQDWSVALNWTGDGGADFAANGGTVNVVDGLVTVHAPTVGGSGVVTVTVTDCADATAECTFTFDVVSALPYKIVIEKDEGSTDLNNDGVLDGALLGQHTQVDVTMEEGTEEMHGFDFLISYDNSVLAFTGAVAGPIFDIPGDNEFEYFTYRYGATGNCGNGCPSGLLRVVGIADQNDGPHSPVNYTVAAGSVLFSLDFLVSNNNSYECQFVPVNFFWMDCGDNSIAYRDKTLDSLDIRQAIAKDVFGYNGTVDGYEIIPDPDFTFPAFTLDTMACIDPQADPKKNPVPFIHFYNGGVDIACNENLDDRGDVNLNGIPYEIADAVVFTNYFIHGMAAFQINTMGQVVATDANADGITLSVADLVYMIRVVVGDALPYPKVAPVETPANIAVNNGIVSVDAELGAVAFVVDGEVLGLGSDATNMELKTAERDGLTYGVIYSFDKGDVISGDFLNISGRLVDIEGASYDGAPMKFVHLPSTFAVKNYPNPFNPTTTIEMALPIASNWTLSIYNVAGQKVKDFSGYNEAGKVDVVFDASSYASGIYFYKFQANNTEITKKMVLLK